MSLKNARTLGLRIDAQDNEILEKIQTETFLEPVSLLRMALKATLKRYHEKGSLTLPIHVLDDADYKALLPAHKLAGNVPATSLLALNEDSQPGNIESLPPRQEVSYDSGKKRKRKNGTED